MISGGIGEAGQVVEGVALDGGADKRNQSFGVEGGDVVHAGDPAGQAESDDLAGDELGSQLGRSGQKWVTIGERTPMAMKSRKGSTRPPWPSAAWMTA